MLGYKKIMITLGGEKKVRKKVSFSVQDSTGSVCVCVKDGVTAAGLSEACPSASFPCQGQKQGRLRLRSLVFVAPRLRP